MNWSMSDFLTLAVLVAVAGLAYVLASRKIRGVRQRAIIAAVIVCVAILVWIELAVGLFNTPFSGN